MTTIKNQNEFKDIDNNNDDNGVGVGLSLFVV